MSFAAFGILVVSSKKFSDKLFVVRNSKINVTRFIIHAGDVRKDVNLLRK